MSVRMKLTHSKTGSRRSHQHTGVPTLVTTSTGVRRRHFIDPDTGMYRGRQIITIGNEKKDTPKKSETVKKEAVKKNKKIKKEEVKTNSQ